MISEWDKALMVEVYGSAIMDSPLVIDEQEFKHDLVFSWNEEGTHLDEIRIINIDENLMVEVGKRYKVILQEIEDFKDKE